MSVATSQIGVQVSADPDEKPAGSPMVGDRLQVVQDHSLGGSTTSLPMPTIVDDDCDRDGAKDLPSARSTRGQRLSAVSFPFVDGRPQSAPSTVRRTRQ